MRRADREVKDRAEILAILDQCESLSLALLDGDYPYVIEMNFGYEDDGEHLRLYFHGAKEGKKLDLMRANPHAAFSASTAHELVAGKVPCATAFKYLSVCGRGDMRMVEGDERMHALRVIFTHYDRESTDVFEEKHANAVCLFAMEVLSFTGKRRLTK